MDPIVIRNVSKMVRTPTKNPPSRRKETKALEKSSGIEEAKRRKAAVWLRRTETFARRKAKERKVKEKE